MPKFVLPFLAAIVGGLLVVGGTAVVWANLQDEAICRERQSRADSGADIKATSIEAVKHAEDTLRLAQAIAIRFDSIASTLGDASESPAAAAIAAEFAQFGAVDVPEYAAGVADFRRVAENYAPISAECG